MILPLLKQFEREYTGDGYATSLASAFEELRKRYANVTILAEELASGFVKEANSSNRERFYRSMEQATGVNLAQVVQGEGLDDVLAAKTRENVALIKSIPEEYLKSVEQAVFQGTVQGNNATSLIKRIKEIGKVSTNKAKLIARDQTSKINSALIQQRQQNLGIEEYVWRTSSDERVRQSHKDNNGKVFKWSEPPEKTGHPGHDVNCRCIAQPILNL